jgi:hypothetical protein
MLVLLIVFITVGLPLAQILRYENVIKNGTSYKVKCTAYDPYDPFMGRYVRLNLIETVPRKDLELTKDIAEDDYFYHDGFVEISADKNGFVKYEKLIENDKHLLTNKNYLKCSIHGNHRSEEDINNGVPRTIRITVEDIDRYYMSDKLAKPAEDAIRDIFSTGSDEDSESDEIVYIELKVLNTLAVPIQLYIDNTRIEDYISK